jgi:trk system potassium uptake protein
MSKRFAVFGLGTFGWEAAISLAEMGFEVIAIDKRIETIDKIKEHVLVAVQFDSTDLQVLESQDIKSVDAAIVGIGSNFEENLLTVVLLKQLGVPKVVSRADTQLRKTILEQVGCDMVVLPEEDMGRRIARSLVSSLFLDRIEVGDQYSIAQITAPSELVGKKIKEAGLRENHHVNLVTIKSRFTKRNLLGQENTREIIKAVPGPDDEIQEGDILVLFGHDNDLNGFAKTFEKSSNGG